MFKSLLATALSSLRLFSFWVGVFCTTLQPALAQEGGFVKFDKPFAMPPLVLHDPKGGETTLKELLQKLPPERFVLLHLWTPSCGLCVEEIRQLDEVKASLADENMTVLSVAEDPSGEHSVPAFIRRQDIKSEGIYIDAAMTAMRVLRPAGVPSTYILSQSGLVMAVHEGARTW